MTATEARRETKAGTREAACRTRKERGATSSRSRRRNSPERAFRRANRRDRRPSEVQQAHDLLLFRRQGGALPAVLEKAYGKVRAAEATTRHRRTCRRSRRSRDWSSSPSTTTIARGIHPPGDDREHSSRRVPRAIEGDPGAERHRHRHIARHLRARRRRRACSGPGSIPSNCIGRSARSASSTSPTARLSRRYSGATSGRKRQLDGFGRNAVEMVLRFVSRTPR